MIKTCNNVLKCLGYIHATIVKHRHAHTYRQTETDRQTDSIHMHIPVYSLLVLLALLWPPQISCGKSGQPFAVSVPQYSCPSELHWSLIAPPESWPTPPVLALTSPYNKYTTKWTDLNHQNVI